MFWFILTIIGFVTTIAICSDRCRWEKCNIASVVGIVILMTGFIVSVAIVSNSTLEEKNRTMISCEEVETSEENFTVSIMDDAVLFQKIDNEQKLTTFYHIDNCQNANIAFEYIDKSNKKIGLIEIKKYRVSYEYSFKSKFTKFFTYSCNVPPITETEIIIYLKK